MCHLQVLQLILECHHLILQARRSIFCRAIAHYFVAHREIWSKHGARCSLLNGALTAKSQSIRGYCGGRALMATRFCLSDCWPRASFSSLCRQSLSLLPVPQLRAITC